MLINFTNHPCSAWCTEQLGEAERWGRIADVPFPDVPAIMDESGISRLADECCARICENAPDAVLVQGEMSLAFSVIERLLGKGITVLCAASERICETTVDEDGSTVRRSVFKFARFRQYGS